MAVMSNTEGPINLTIEIDERITLSDSDKKLEAYCSGCKKMTEMATPQMSGVLTDISEREVFRLIEAGEIHFIENARVLICVDSLRQLKGDFSTA